MSTTPSETMTVAEVAERLQCSENHLRTLERTGRLPFPSLRLGDGWLRFSRAAVDAYLGGRAYADALLATIDRQQAELAAVSAILAALTTDTAAGQRIIADALGALAETRRAVVTTIGYTAAPAANGAGAEIGHDAPHSRVGNHG